MGPTRERILDLLKRRAEATARELATALGITPPAVRQHLTALERDGLVTGRTLRRPVGRPVFDRKGRLFFEGSRKIRTFYCGGRFGRW